jgi:hypothetical protein
MDNSKINLNEIYTAKEIQDIKKIIPTMSTLIMSNIGKLNKYPNITFSSSSKKEEDNSNQYISKNKFIELILEKSFVENSFVVLYAKLCRILCEIIGGNKQEECYLRRKLIYRVKNCFDEFN